MSGLGRFRYRPGGFDPGEDLVGKGGFVIRPEKDFHADLQRLRPLYEKDRHRRRRRAVSFPDVSAAWMMP